MGFAIGNTEPRRNEIKKYISVQNTPLERMEAVNVIKWMNNTLHYLIENQFNVFRHSRTTAGRVQLWHEGGLRRINTGFLILEVGQHFRPFSMLFADFLFRKHILTEIYKSISTKLLVKPLTKQIPDFFVPHSLEVLTKSYYKNLHMYLQRLLQRLLQSVFEDTCRVRAGRKYDNRYYCIPFLPCK